MNAPVVGGLSADEFVYRGYKNVAKDIASMSKEELAVILSGISARVQLISASWKARDGYGHERYKSPEWPSVSRILAALHDYEQLSLMEDCRAGLDLKLKKISSNLPIGGCVYVAEFSDGHIKIGHSTTPELRIKAIAGGNQASLTRSWISVRIKKSSSIESKAHRRFSSDRVGGEFFRASFDDAVTWVAKKIQNAKMEPDVLQ